MPPARRRRNVVEEDESDEEEPQTQRRRGGPPSDESEEDEEENDDDIDVDGVEGEEQLVKKFVRYALACEYQRIAIKRGAVSEKVFLKKRVNFKRIFELAQKQLRTKFGMALVELPVREKTTMKEKRDAQKKKTNAKAPASYILITILPNKYRIPEIIIPSIIGSSSEEAQYVALCTTVVAMIALSNSGTLPNVKLEAHLKRLNIERNMPMNSTQNMLKKMAAQQYIFKIVDRSGDEETIDWIIGPRGHAEIGKLGVKRFVEEIYGEKAPDDLTQRLEKSLGMGVERVDREEEAVEEEEEVRMAADDGDPGPSAQRRPGRPRRLADDE